MGSGFIGLLFVLLLCVHTWPRGAPAGVDAIVLATRTCAVCLLVTLGTPVLATLVLQPAGLLHLYWIVGSTLAAALAARLTPTHWRLTTGAALVALLPVLASPFALPLAALWPTPDVLTRALRMSLFVGIIVLAYCGFSGTSNEALEGTSAPPTRRLLGLGLWTAALALLLAGFAPWLPQTASTPAWPAALQP